MTIEGFRPCSDVPFGAALADEEPPCAMAPFTEASLALWEAPAGPVGALVAVIVVFEEVAGCCAGTAPANCAWWAEDGEEAFEAWGGWLCGDAALRMRWRRHSGAGDEASGERERMATIDV